ncbi:hypothetical protein QAD02_015396 [Eretmocerus hayati]|uniref:Uncharacterized protein n=1 Tax=Eretmocerus hayati TaxID=131215 RepID=A0ACC2PAL3_9HYME|nr:hypothetical protein QAD02_015396 [Eretmocerus hayati]
MELVNGGRIEILSRRSIIIKDYLDENDDDEKRDDDADRTSLKDLSMAEQFYYEVISSFENEELKRVKNMKLMNVCKNYISLFFASLNVNACYLSTPKNKQFKAITLTAAAVYY